MDAEDIESALNDLAQLLYRPGPLDVEPEEYVAYWLKEVTPADFDRFLALLAPSLAAFGDDTETEWHHAASTLLGVWLTRDEADLLPAFERHLGNRVVRPALIAALSDITSARSLPLLTKLVEMTPDLTNDEIYWLADALELHENHGAIEPGLMAKLHRALEGDSRRDAELLQYVSARVR